MKTKNNIKSTTKVFFYDGIMFKMSATFKGNTSEAFGDGLIHPKFVVTISTDKGTTRFNYFASHNDYKKGLQELNRAEMKNALYCFLSDGLYYEDTPEFMDFCNMFGYSSITDYPKARKAFEGCKRHHLSAVRVFGSNYCNIVDIINNEE